MFGFLTKAPAWRLVLQADTMIKIVLFSLFLLSVFCVSIAISKFFILWNQKRTMRKLRLRLLKVSTFEELLNISKNYKNSTAGKFLVKAIRELKEFLDDGKSSITDDDIEKLKLITEQVVDEVLSEEESYLPVLGTSAAVAPLVGLFGTVWGLVHAFVDISHKKSADISVVAPGIAEALTTTLAGLAVAIPALVFFHYFSNEIRKLEHQLWLVSDKFLNIIKKKFGR